MKYEEVQGRKVAPKPLRLVKKPEMEKPILGNLEAGYVAFNGHVFTQAEADSYNVYNFDLKRHYELGNVDALNYCLSLRSLWFKVLIGMIP